MKRIVHSSNRSTPVHHNAIGWLAGFYLLGAGEVAWAQDVSYTGTTGILSTPNALIATPGAFSFQYNDFIESRFDNDFSDGGNYVFTLGVFPRFELAGRLTDYDPIGEEFSARGTRNGKRDLSGNAKFNVFNISDRYWISVGVTDFAGLAQNFTSVYAVGSAQWRGASFSIGAAGGDNSSFDGVFANAQYRVNPYLSLAAEVDTSQAINAGITASLPVSKKLSLHATVSGGDDETRAALTARFTFDSTPYRTVLTGNDVANNAVGPQLAEVTSDKDNRSILADLGTELANSGLQRVRVGQTSDTYYLIELENRLLIHSDYDAMAEVVRIAQSFLPKDSTVELTFLEQGIHKFRTTIPLDGTVGDVLPVLPGDAERVNTQWVTSAESSKRSLADFFIEPALVTRIGTEFGAIDYSLATRLGVSVPLWRGAQAVLGAFVPLVDSSNFDAGEPFADSAFDSSLERALIVQYLPPVNDIYSQIELGRVQLRGFDYNAAKVQAAWQSLQWPVLLHASIGQYRLEDTNIEREVILGSATLNVPRWDSTLTATYGQFFFGERAVALKATRRFGSTFASLFFRIISDDDLAGGIQFSAPFGPRKALQWKRLTFSGSPRWSHAVQTTIEFPDSSDNRLQPSLLFEPLTDSEIPQRILDSGRLNRFDFIRYGRFFKTNDDKPTTQLNQNP